MIDKDLKLIVDEIIDSTKRIINGSPLNNLFDLSTEDTTYYVDGTNGSDDNDGSYSKPFKTLGKAYGSIPKFYNNKYIIDISKKEEYTITKSDVEALEEKKYGNIKSKPIVITGSGLSSNTNIIFPHTYIYIVGLENIIFKECKITTDNKSFSLHLNNSSNITFDNCDINCSMLIDCCKDVTLKFCTLNACNSSNIISATESYIDIIGGLNINSNGESNVSGIKITYGDLRVKCDIAVDSGVVSDIISNYSTVISYTS